MFQVVLYQPEIPPNTGNIARLSVATQTRLHLVEPLGFSIEDRYLRRAGLDYWDRLDLKVHASFESVLKDKDIQRLWLLSSKVEKPYFEADFLEGDTFVFGPETRGLPADILERYPQQCLAIPMPGQIRSLNLSSAVAVVVYEALRQVRYNHSRAQV